MAGQRLEADLADRYPSGTITDLWGGYTCTARIQYPFYADIVAPSGVTIGNTFGGRRARQIRHGLWRPNAHVKLYRGGTGNMTLVLEAKPFAIETFGGWTKDSTVVDRLEHPRHAHRQ